METKKKTSGFTLLEILIVVGLIALLAAMAIPNFVQARSVAKQNVCIKNLAAIDSAKEQYAIDNDIGEGEVIADPAVLDPFIKGGYAGLICPAGGTYSANAVGSDPTCSIASHTL